MRDGIVPPTLNLDNPSVETEIDLVPHTAKKKPINTALSNSFGFGGTNAQLIGELMGNDAIARLGCLANAGSLGIATLCRF
jgi:acyl transferase domain-containing protein